MVIWNLTSPQPLLSTLRRRVVVPGKALPALVKRYCHGNENVCGPVIRVHCSIVTENRLVGV